MSKTPDPKYRPAPEDRWTDGMRTEPVRLAVRTEWLYDEEPRIVALPEGRTHWPFARGGNVTASDLPAQRESQQDFNSHMHRAMTAFGDDKDLVVEVRLASGEPTDAEVENAAQALYEDIDWKHGPDWEKLPCADQDTYRRTARRVLIAAGMTQTPQEEA